MRHEFKRAIRAIFLLMIFTVVASSCSKDEETETPDGSTTVTDIDGNVYHTVTIGTQVWMVENLKTTKYRDGTPISQITDDELWRTTNEGACCSYDNNVSNSAKYGRLYNWFAVSTPRYLAPAGWHVATDADWATLEAFLGAATAGTKIKAVNEWGGTFGNTYATNESGFAALPAGYRTPNYVLSYTAYENLGQMTHWWTSTDHSWNPEWALMAGASSSQPAINRSASDKRCGYSVRCVKD